MAQRETVGHWSVDKKGNVIQTGMGGIVASCPSLADAEAICVLHNAKLDSKSQLAEANLIAELRSERDTAQTGWREEIRMRAEDLAKHATEIESLTAPKSSVDRVIEKTEAKKKDVK